MVSVIAYISEALLIILVPIASQHISPFKIMSFAVFSSCITIFLSSYIENLYFFCILVGVITGYMSAFITFPAVWLSWERFPNHKGLGTSANYLGYRGSPFYYGILFTLIVNPKEQYPANGYFSADIYESVPSSLRIFACTLFVVGITGCLMMFSSKSVKHQEEFNQTYTLLEVLKDWRFHYLFFFMTLKSFFNYYIINTYKIMAFEKINDDYYLAYIGSIGFFSSGLLAIVYGKILDNFEYRKVNLVLILIDIAICALIPIGLDYKYIYGFLIAIEIGLGGNSFMTVWLMSEKIYKNEKWIVSLLSLSLIVDFVGVYAVDNFIRINYGNTVSLGVCLVIILISLLFLSVDLEKTYSKKDRLIELH